MIFIFNIETNNQIKIELINSEIDSFSNLVIIRIAKTSSTNDPIETLTISLHALLQKNTSVAKKNYYLKFFV